MALLQDQQFISKQVPMPVDDMSVSSSTQSITGETVPFFYSNSGARTADAGQAAGVAVVAALDNKNILDVEGGAIGTYNDTSLSFTSTAFTSEVPFPYEEYRKNKDLTWAAKLAAVTANFSNGDYCVDYRNGILYGVKASTQTSLTSAAYKINQAQSGAAGGLSAQVEGTVASGATDSGNPVKVGGVYNSTKPTLTDGQRGDLQLNSRSDLLVSLGTNLNQTDDDIGAVSKASATITGVSTLRDIDIDNTAQALSANPGNLYGARLYNLNTFPVWVHFYDLTTGSVTPTSTTPKYSVQVPAGDGTSYGECDPLAFTPPMTFATAMTYMACTQYNPSAGTATDPTVGLVGMFTYKSS